MSEQAKATQEPAGKDPLYVEFEIDGVTLVYDYSQLRLAQMKLAEAVYGYQVDLEKRPPRSWKEKLDLGGADYDLHVLSYILLRKNPDGSLQGFKGGETQRPILDLVSRISAADAAKAEEVIEDFFLRRDRYTLALLVRTKYDRAFGELLQGMIKATATQHAETSPERSPSDNSDSDDSGAPASDADD